MMIIIAIEHSILHRRIAIKILLLFGCSHYRLSFLLFFSTMVLSMWCTNSIACGLMMPLVKAILKELEHRPTDFTIFYFLGIAYSSSIGGMSTIIGSETNKIFKNYCEVIFPRSPTIEVPQLMLLTLPGVLIMEMFLYLWLNFYFLGMLRVQNYTALQATLTGDEEQYISILLKTKYQQLGKIKFHEGVVGTTVILTALFQAIISSTYTNDRKHLNMLVVLNSSAPSLISALLLFIMPVNLNCLKFFKNKGNSEPTPTSPSNGCLTWSLVKDNMEWSVLFVIGSSNMIFEAMRESKMTDEFEKFLLLFTNLPAPVLALIVIVFSKVMTEFGSNASVIYCLLIHIVKVSVKAEVNPLYLMICASLSTSLPFHLITGTPSNAMVSAYVNIPPRKMMIAGIGPSIVAILTNLFTVCIWSKAIWPDISVFPDWAHPNYIKEF
ncbi:protein I'm not dead yet-like [Vanessa tameamea]|uniref:Protein I'm not dead yet-like n=1 Tax=Vanessa tameamea TaxID=334116 RepID=A0ABM4AT23_VANTA